MTHCIALVLQPKGKVMSIPTRRRVAFATLAVLVLAFPAAAQIPNEFTNLKVLPKETNKRDLMTVMRAFSGALGVRCNYCHVGEDPSDFTGYDFASDDKESKRIAREMMKMTMQINENFIGKLEGEHNTRVRCVTCHSGVKKPETVDNIILAAAETDGVEQASAKYRELRDEYYGQGAYNFGPGPLNNVAEKLAQEKNDIEGAIAIMKMNIELNPDQAYSHIFLGQLYQAAGQQGRGDRQPRESADARPGQSLGKGYVGADQGCRVVTAAGSQPKPGVVARQPPGLF